MGLITVEELREIFDISPKITDGRFRRALSAGSKRLRDWVGNEVYDDALSSDPEDADRAETLQYAEAHLVMHFAVLGINTALRQTGIVSSERVEGQTTISYLTPGQIASLQSQYLEEAEAIAKPYLLPQGDAIPVVGSNG